MNGVIMMTMMMMSMMIMTMVQDFVGDLGNNDSEEHVEGFGLDDLGKVDLRSGENWTMTMRTSYHIGVVMTMMMS